MYYRKWEDGTIMDFSETKYAEECLFTDEEIVKASDGHYYLKSEQSLEELKTTKLEALKATRNRLEIEPVEYNGKFYDYDSDARDRINAAIIRLKKAGADAAIAWTCADNSDAMVTYEDLENVVSNVADRSNLLHIKYRQLKELVESCSTIEELDAIRWEGF